MGYTPGVCWGSLRMFVFHQVILPFFGGVTGANTKKLVQWTRIRIPDTHASEQQFFGEAIFQGNLTKLFFIGKMVVPLGYTP